MKNVRLSFFAYIICMYVPLAFMYGFPESMDSVIDEVQFFIFMFPFAGALILFPAHLFFLFKNLKIIHQKDSLSALYYCVDTITFLFSIVSFTVILILATAYA